MVDLHAERAARWSRFIPSGITKRVSVGYHEARQRTSSDLKLSPHMHVVFLDGAYRDRGDELDFRAAGHLSTRDFPSLSSHGLDVAGSSSGRGLLDRLERTGCFLSGLHRSAQTGSSQLSPALCPTERRASTLHDGGTRAASSA